MAVPYTKLYYKTDDIIARFKPSLSNYFNVNIGATFDGINTTEENSIDFLAYEAVLPGTSYETTQVFGDRQGITETFANKRVYPPVDVSFYIDHNYNVLRFFEDWMASMNPNKGVVGNSYQKFYYPKNNSITSGYKKEVTIYKFERNFREPSQRLVEGGVYSMPPNRCSYVLRNAYPTNLISVPLSYDGSNILRTTVTFNYDVYAFFKYGETGEINPPDGSSGSSASSGGDSAQATQTATQAAQSTQGPSRSTINQTVAELKAMQEASRLRQAGFSPGLGQSGRYGPGF